MSPFPAPSAVLAMCSMRPSESMTKTQLFQTAKPAPGFQVTPCATGR